MVILNVFFSFVVAFYFVYCFFGDKEIVKCYVGRFVFFFIVIIIQQIVKQIYFLFFCFFVLVIYFCFFKVMIFKSRNFLQLMRQLWRVCLEFFWRRSFFFSCEGYVSGFFCSFLGFVIAVVRVVVFQLNLFFVQVVFSQ